MFKSFAESFAWAEVELLLPIPSSKPTYVVILANF